MREEPPHVLEAAIRARLERERQERAREQHSGKSAFDFSDDQQQADYEASKGHGEPDGEPQANGHGGILPLVLGSDLARRPRPVRQFLDSRSLMPQRNVILLSGDGGMGKSLVALQLALACTTGTQWLGMDVVPGPVLYLSAEDDEDEIDIRCRDICAAEGIEFNSAYTLNIASMAGEDVTLAIENPKTKQLVVTDVYRRLDAAIEMVSPVVVILDNQADVYGGNESHRSQVKHFIGMLRRIAMQRDCVVLLLSHPSLTGRSSGTGESGSTAWNNSVRCRMYLHMPEGADADEEGDRRILEVMKANYAKKGVRIGLKWANHRFVQDEGARPFDRVSVHDLDKVQLAFGRTATRVNEKADDWGGYIVAEILDLDIGQGLGMAQRSIAQNRARDDVRVYLSTWVRNGALFIVDGVNSFRRPTKFYSPIPQRTKGGRDEEA